MKSTSRGLSPKQESLHSVIIHFNQTLLETGKGRPREGASLAQGHTCKTQPMPTRLSLCSEKDQSRPHRYEELGTRTAPPPHGCPSTKYIKPTHRALSYLLLLQMIPDRKFLQRQGEIFPPNLFTFQISVAITTQHNYLCEAFSFQVLPSTTLCGEFNSALSITTHFFNQFGSGIFFFYKHT